jgi:hypothetical protein
MKRVSMVLALLVVAFTLIGCSTVPSWVINPPRPEDALIGVGMMKSADLNIAKTAAEGRARDDLARQISTSVKNSLSNYFQEAGVGNQTQVVKFVENVSKQIADQTIAGSRPYKAELTPDGTYYVALIMPLKSVVAAANEEFKRNESAEFAQFKAEQALKKLDFDLSNNPPKSTTK